MRAQNRSQQGGFTLIELLVVVAILAVLASLSISTMSSKPKIEETANLLALRVSDAAREARSAGPVVATVVAAERPVQGSERTTLEIRDDGAGQYFSVMLRKEISSTTSQYNEVARTYVRKETVVSAVAEGFAQTGASPPAGTAVLLTNPYSLPCSPTSGCGPVTFYLTTTTVQSANGFALPGDPATTAATVQVYQYRVVVMPLATLPLVLSGW